MTATPTAEPAWPRRRGADWIENLKTNDPVRYAAIQQRRQVMQQDAQDAWGRSFDYFLGRDTSNMAEQDLEEYGRMMNLLDETRTLALQLQNVPPEDRREVMSAVRSNIVVLTPLLNNERDRELYDMSLATGQDTAKAASTVGYVNQIISNTSVRSIFPNLPRGGFLDGRSPGVTSPAQASATPRPTP